MYVSPNSYVFVNDQFIYVTQDVNLNAATSNFYLRNSSQLLQGTAIAGTNRGLGRLSVFQEGTSNNFGYNYFCSPVGTPSVALSNGNFGIELLNVPTTVTASSLAAVTGSYDGVSSAGALTISNRWIYKYIQSNNYGAWSYVGAAANNINTGLGFTMKGVSGSDATIAHAIEGVANNPGNNQRYDFRGKPNDGLITIPVGITAGPDYPNRTLTGNPYPSAINLNLFLLENSGRIVNYVTGTYTAGGLVNVINGNAYFWEHVKSANSHILNQYIGGYGTYAPTAANAFSPGTYTAATWNTYNADGTPNTTGGTTGSTYERMFTPIGQGFKIQGTAVGAAQMKNIYRSFVKEGVASNSQFERAASSNIDIEETGNWDEIPNVAGVDYTQFSKLQAPQFKLHTIINNAYTRETAIAFNEFATDMYDLALDGLAADANLPRDTYFPLDGDRQFVISTLPFDINKRIPVAFKSDVETSYSVSVSELINFNLAENIYMFDKTTGIYHDIKNGMFNVTVAAGNIKDRFEVTFKNAQDALNETEFSVDSFQVFQNNNNSMLTVVNTLNKDVASLKLYDVSGKIIVNKVNLGKANQYEISTSGLSDGIYIVKLTTKDNLAIDKKVSIFKK